ncbi:MAG TPA: adenylate/guanylate cyclase domain-containing protein, partial [Acidimicrobiales bacterium]
MDLPASGVASVTPYLPRLVVTWLSDGPEQRWREVEGTIAFVDISGFTKLSERLAKRGKVGAEELTDTIDGCFAELLSVAYANGGGLLKFGGDALLLLFTGPGHEARACQAAVGMRRTLRDIGRLEIADQHVQLRMSIGVNSGTFQFFLVGSSHRELIVTGPAASTTVTMEATASAGEIVVSEETAGALGRGVVGSAKGPGYLLRRAPSDSAEWLEELPQGSGADLIQCIPVALREDILARSHEAEHRRATIAFLHFDGTDGLISALGADEAAVRLDDLVCKVQHAVDQHQIVFLGSDVDRDGGKIILAAGARTNSGDDERRMLLALREIMDHDPAVPVRVGVNRGPVFAGNIGPPYRRTFTVMGDAVNLAARVMARAAPGQILATEDVIERCPGGFEAVALEPFLVKGKAKPVHAHAVGSAIRANGRHVRSELPLIGRDDELGILLDALDFSRAGVGQVVELVGEPGVGKSRLVEELRRHAEGMQLHSISCDAYESSTPYFPFRGFLQALLHLTECPPKDTAVTRLGEELGLHTPALLPWAPLLAALL